MFLFDCGSLFVFMLLNCPRTANRTPVPLITLFHKLDPGLIIVQGLACPKFGIRRLFKALTTLPLRFIHCPRALSLRAVASRLLQPSSEDPESSSEDPEKSFELAESDHSVDEAESEKSFESVSNQSLESVESDQSFESVESEKLFESVSKIDSSILMY